MSCTTSEGNEVLKYELVEPYEVKVGRDVKFSFKKGDVVDGKIFTTTCCGVVRCNTSESLVLNSSYSIPIEKLKPYEGKKNNVIVLAVLGVLAIAAFYTINKRL